MSEIQCGLDYVCPRCASDPGVDGPPEAARSEGYDLAVAALRNIDKWVAWRAVNREAAYFQAPFDVYARYLAAIKADVLGTETKETTP